LAAVSSCRPATRSSRSQTPRPSSTAAPSSEEDFDRAFAEIEPRLRRANGIVVYCSGFGCEASHVVARRLRERGLIAAILNEGIPAWLDAGLPMDSEPRS
jgi:rhodanese-related sulfurtransferase